MKLRAPHYYKEFKCIANKCKHNCCKAGWEIDIDKTSANTYKNTHSDFGQKLNANIDFKEPVHFILNKDGICPFLNTDDLCEIYINLGEKNLCQICKDHPRYYEWFDGVKECGIGLCCEEAARIILTNRAPFSVYETEISEETFNFYDKELYSYLLNARSKIISYLDNESISLHDRIKNILWYVYTLQQNIDNNLLDDEEIIDVKINKKNNFKNIFEFYFSLDFNNKNYLNYLKNNLKFCDNFLEINNIFFDKNLKTNNNFTNKNLQKSNTFFNKKLDINNYLKNISIYFIWRYFLQATFDGDVLSRTKFMATSIAVLEFLFFCKLEETRDLSFENIINIVRCYSEEIEYSEENLQKLADASYELNIFSTEKIMELFS